MLSTINEFLNSSMFLIIVSLVIFFVVVKLIKKDERATKMMIFEALIKMRDRRTDMRVRKILKAIPPAFKRSPKVKEALQNYILSDSGTEINAEGQQDSTNKYDNLITEIGRDIKVFKDNQFYEGNQFDEICQYYGLQSVNNREKDNSR